MKGMLSHRGAAILMTLMLALMGSGLVRTAAGPAEAKAPTGAAGQVQPVDLNGAGVEELLAIPGIGQVMAQRIIDFREQHGPFKRIEDLMKVKGIGEKSFQKLRPYLKVSNKG